jgi:hypothetical protein
MRLPGMTTRRWMIAVVASVLLLGAEVTRRRWDRISLAYRRRAESAVGQGVAAHELANDLSRHLEGPDGNPDPAVYEALVRAMRRRGHFRSLSVKYYYAASHPWLPVEADPPEPPSPIP